MPTPKAPSNPSRPKPGPQNVKTPPKKPIHGEPCPNPDGIKP